MTAIPITCDNCGAKYRLPENFTGTQSKCQKCGSVIDVAKQRSSATSPAGALPAAAAKPAAAARPAVDRSRETPKPAERRPKHSEPAPRSSGTAEADRNRSRSKRGERPAKKGSAMPFVIGGVGLLAIIVVVVLVKSAG